MYPFILPSNIHRTRYKLKRSISTFLLFYRKAADGSSIVDIEVVLLDSEGITEDDVMGVITSAFPFTGLGGSRYTSK